MKKILLMLALSPIATIQAQEKSMYGAFGQFYGGPAFLPSQTVTSYLAQPDMLGNAYDPQPFGYTIGSEMAEMFEHFYIGIGGFRVIKPVSSSQLGSAKVNIGGGYLKFGYRYHSTANSFMHIYAGIGGMSYSIDLDNFSDTAQIKFNRKSALPPRGSASYSVTGFLFDLGTGIKTFVFSEGDESDKSRFGMLVGIDAGCFITVSISEWSQTHAAVTGPPDLLPMCCPYLRVSIGGGGFRCR